jgi:predicted short-subunit dehydrogenase-like oxidoreductase (DUF2520 family)
VEHQTLNIIGCGKLGQALGRLFLATGAIQHLRICNRTIESSRRAADLVGGGEPFQSISELPQSKLWMVASPDSEIERLACFIRDCADVRDEDVIFHCSGALSSTVLSPVRAKGASIASVHPIRSFADPLQASERFSGTHCASEGDDAAMVVLRNLFEAIGGRVFSIRTEAKLLVHSGHVFASNYLVALVECAERIYARAGIAEETYREFLGPLVLSAAENVSTLGVTRALTGPISRGQVSLVEDQYRSVQGASSQMAMLYAALGAVAAEIGERQGLPPAVVAELKAKLSN